MTEPEYPAKQTPVDWLWEAGYRPFKRTMSVHVSYAGVVDMKKYLQDEGEDKEKVG